MNTRSPVNRLFRGVFSAVADFRQSAATPQPFVMQIPEGEWASIMAEQEESTPKQRPDGPFRDFDEWGWGSRPHEAAHPLRLPLPYPPERHRQHHDEGQPAAELHFL